MRKAIIESDDYPQGLPRETLRSWAPADDLEHWNRFYRQPNENLLEPSNFAVSSAAAIPARSLVFELGCGNGRDSLFLAEQGSRVIACDLSEEAITRLQERVRTLRWEHPPTFFVENFARLSDHHAKDLDFVYTRFTLHAVRRRWASHALQWSFAHLGAGGQILIEARSVEGSLYGKGQCIGRDEYVHDGHYRRFLRRRELVAELQQIGFEVVSQIESDGLAAHGSDDPVVIRVVARRR